VKARRSIVIVVLSLSPLLASCRDGVQAFEQAAIPVRVVEVQRGSFTPKLSVFGTVRPGRSYELSSGPGGSIRYAARFVDGLRTGEHVVAGEELAWIENPDAQLAVAEARISVEIASSQLDRTRASFEEGLVSRVELERDKLQLDLATERLSAAEARAARRSVRAPDNGVLVVDRVFAPGTEVSAGAILGMVAREGVPRVEAVAAAGELSRLEPGLLVRISARGGEAVEGRLTEVSRIVDDAGTIRIVAEPLTEEGLPAPGEGVNLEVNLEPLADVVSVPEQSLVFGAGDQAAVFVVDAVRIGDNLAVARRVDVVVGGRNDDQIAVLTGLTNGDLVVTTGAAMLGDRSSVKVTGREESR